MAVQIFDTQKKKPKIIQDMPCLEKEQCGKPNPSHRQIFYSFKNLQTKFPAQSPRLIFFRGVL
jgi:hypothetical protein